MYKETSGKLKRADQLQFLRFLAFLFIYFYHAYMLDLGILNQAISGQVAILFFFCLTGAVAAYSLYPKRNEPVTSKKVIAYIWKKILRFYPLYFLTNVYTVSYSGLRYSINNGDIKSVIREIVMLIKDLSLVRSIIPWELYSHNGVTWYVSAIVFLSILNLPANRIIGRIMGQKNAPAKLVMIFIGALVYTGVIDSLFRIVGILDIALTNPIIKAGLHIMGMTVGYMSILYIDKNADTKDTKRLLFTVFEMVSLILMTYIVFQQNRKIFTLLGDALTIVILFIFLIGAGCVSDILRHKWLVHLGDISFECFMVHQIVIHEYCQINGWDNYSTTGKIVGLVVCLAITIIIAELLHRVHWENLYGKLKWKRNGQLS